MLVVRVWDTLTNRRYWVVVKHMIASQQNPRRDREGEEDIAVTVQWLDDHDKLCVLLGGDLNLVPTHSNLAPIRARLQCVGLALGKLLPTFGSRSIDSVWFRVKPWLELIGQSVVIINPKDHNGYIAHFLVKKRNRVVALVGGLFGQ